MFESFNMRIVAVRDWNAASVTRQRDMLPTTPGIYSWMLDLRQPYERAADDQDRVLLSELRAVIHPETPRLFDGRVPPYTKVSLHDAPPPLTPKAEANIDGIASLEAGLAEWALLCPTMLQRPMYVGKAKNLRRRLRDHLLGRTALVGYLREVGLTLNDCAILVTEVTPAPPSPDEEEEEDDEEAWDGADSDSLEGLDSTTAMLISAAESLTIRMSRPLLNIRMD